MTDPVSTTAEPCPVDGSRGALGRLRAVALERVKTFAKRHELSLLLAIAAASMLAYLSLGPASSAAPVAAAPTAAAKPDAPASVPVAVRGQAPIVFQVRALVISGDKAREHSARLVLNQDGLSVTAADSPRRLLQSLDYDNIRSMTYSHGRDPMRHTAKGPVPVRRRGGAFGRLGLFVERHWIVVEAQRADRYVILRLDDRVVNPVLDALRARTGRRPEVIASP
jgi:hypothetical protein